MKSVYNFVVTPIGERYNNTKEVEGGDLIGYKPKTECEFVIDGERLYRVLSNFITIKYEYQGDEEEYNPSWAESS